ncbi:MAG TPA: haloacid dehalogenase [Actinomycetota bacterium]|nr:haloacid dehalogenase [Actinomycetota bacterium]
MDLESLSRDLHRRFDAKTAARERALPAARRSIRASANAIRAVHRGEFDVATRLIGESRAALAEGLDGIGDHPDVRYAGYLLDAEKEFAEANLTLALVTDAPLPSPTDVGVGDAPYLNGMAEAIGEGRRHVLDLLRVQDVERAERVLASLEEMYGLLVTMDYPDAITMNLRRSTDVARSLIEKTRGDLSIAVVQRTLRDALDRHAELLRRDDAT